MRYFLFIDIKQNELPNKCDNFMQFLNILKYAQIQKERVIIVLDRCEMLEYNQLVVFSQLQKLIGSYQLCVILVSQVCSRKFDTDIDFIPIVFEQYNSGNIILHLLFLIRSYFL